MICVIATIETLPGRRDDFVALLKALVPQVVAEDGCLEYVPMTDVSTSIAAQVQLRNSVVTVVEKWESLEALEAHLLAPHMVEFRRESEGMRTGVSLQVLQPL